MATNAPQEESDLGFGKNLVPKPERIVALSIKQPWAALLVAGIKTVEVRTWQTNRRGRVVIHASKIADDRPEGWAFITTPELEKLAGLRGGLIGVGELTNCLRYSTAEEFAATTEQHRNAPEWFLPAGLFGFVFQNVRQIAYHAYAGKTMFFAVEPISKINFTAL